MGKKIGLVALLILVLVVLVVVFVKIKTVNEVEKSPEIVNDNENTEETSEPENVENIENTENTENIENTENEYGFMELKALPVDYSKDQAINDNCVVLLSEYEVYNTELLAEFEGKVKSNQNAFVRVYTLSADGILYIYDAELKDGVFTMTSDWSRDENQKVEEGVEKITPNEYKMSEYEFSKKESVINENDQIVVYSITKKSEPSEEYYLAAYVIRTEVNQDK